VQHDLDPDLAAAVERTLQLLSDSAAYNKRLAELRGIAAAADSKLNEVRAMNQQAADSAAVMKDAMAMLARQSAREQALADKEADLRERESALALATKTADDDHVRQQPDLTARAKLLDQRAEHLEGARKLLRDGIQRLRDEWVALRKVGEDIEALPTMH
jgi:predicted metal-dependent hydrolase